MFENLKAGPVSITPLYLAAQKLDINVISFLISYSANILLNESIAKLKVPSNFKT